MNVGRTSIGALMLSAALFLLSGCGSGVEEALFQAAAATGRSTFDLFLTDFANALANGFEDIIQDGDDGDGSGDGGAGDGDTGDGDTTDGDGNGDAGPDGGALFASNCAACHGNDGASGFAPAITGATADEVIAAMAIATHSSIDLSDEELSAIAVWLGGGPTDGGGTTTGDAAAGEAVFTANACGACHCADASGGCALDAPSLQGVSADVLDSNLRGNDAHTGGKFDLSDQDISDVGAYLASL